MILKSHGKGIILKKKSQKLLGVGIIMKIFLHNPSQSIHRGTSVEHKQSVLDFHAFGLGKKLFSQFSSELSPRACICQQNTGLSIRLLLVEGTELLRLLQTLKSLVKDQQAGVGRGSVKGVCNVQRKLSPPEAAGSLFFTSQPMMSSF